MPNKFGTPEHWRMRATTARAMAESIEDNAAKRAMLEIADNYEKIAVRTEAKEAGVPIHPDGHLTHDS